MSAASLDLLLSKGLIDQFVSAYLTTDALALYCLGSKQLGHGYRPC
jgi:hypothetical protein